MVTVVDYGLGNVRAFLNIYRSLDLPARAARTEAELADAERIILPGVGAFDWAMTRLNQSGMRACLDRLVVAERRPVLGVCVGMQMMASASEEGQCAGLGWVPGVVRRLRATEGEAFARLPHMGWNDVRPTQPSPLFDPTVDPRFYFLHSFHFTECEPRHVLATTDYAGTFVSAIRADHILGVQFHPEKSHEWGIELLRNFAVQS